MQAMSNIFNTREIAIGIWIIIGLFCFVSFGKGRKSLQQFIKAAVQRQLVVLYLAIFLYCGLVVYALYLMNFWQWSFLKDTIIWTVLSGIGMLMRHEQSNGFKNHMKNYLKDAISMTAIVVFVSSANTFNIWIELISVPILVILGGAQAYAENEPRSDYKRVVKVLQCILVAYGLIAISYSLHGIIGEYQEFFATETLRNFLLPVVLLIAFIPFYYTFALYSAYEVVLIQLKCPIAGELSLVKHLKRRLCKYAGINLSKIEQFYLYRQYANPFIKSKEDIDRFFDWLVYKDIDKIILKHKILAIDDLPWDAVVRVTLKNGTVVTGEYGYWTNAFHNEPNGEIIFVENGEVLNELQVDEIISIEQIGSFTP